MKTSHILAALMFVAVTTGAAAANSASATTSATKTTQATQTTSKRYQTYTPKSFDAAKDMQRVLFFHAGWCPACKKADVAFEKDVKNFPKNLSVFKVDYDKEKALRKKYGITGQHTFVLVDAKGEALKKWIGGSTKKLLDATKTKTAQATKATSKRYQTYTPKSFDAAKDMQRVLFFHAGWCPACKKADVAFEKDVKNFPKNLSVFKVDYDKEKALRKKYGITGQHTFVLVDAKGEALKKWIGGSTKKLLDMAKGQ